MLDFEPDATAANNSAVADATAIANANLTNGLLVIADVAAAVDPWCLNTDCSVCTPAARRMAKSWQVKPAFNAILCARNIDAYAALLRAVTDHTSLSAACELARISLSKEQ